jgi:hypothetical protein
MGPSDVRSTDLVDAGLDRFCRACASLLASRLGLRAQESELRFDLEHFDLPLNGESAGMIRSRLEASVQLGEPGVLVFQQSSRRGPERPALGIPPRRPLLGRRIR